MACMTHSCLPPLVNKFGNARLLQSNFKHHEPGLNVTEKLRVKKETKKEGTVNRKLECLNISSKTIH